MMRSDDHLPDVSPPVPQRRRSRKWLVGLSVFGLSCCLLVVYYGLRPHYLTVDAGRWQWDYVKKSTVLAHEVGNAYETDYTIWMWQASGNFFVGMDGDVDAIQQEFETLLTEDEWYVASPGLAQFSCEFYLEVVPDSDEKLLVYHSHKDSEITACLYLRAALPYLKVTVATTNPSPKSKWWSPCPFGC